MKRTIRAGVFETNSSSCHSVVIANTPCDEYDTGTYYTTGGRFDRYDKMVLTSTAEKLDYFWQVVIDNCVSLEEGYLNQSEWHAIITSILPNATLDVEYNKYGMPEGWVDHGGSYVDMLAEMYNDNSLVTRLLLNPQSFVAMSSDEDYERPDYPDCDYIEFGNDD